jgi:F-type H+-transporting ATPase subunit beta
MVQMARSGETGASLGRVVAVHGSVVDVRFPQGELPAIAQAVTIDREIGGTLIAEVQLHLDATTARVVALDSTAGLKRGAPAQATGGPIKVPVGEPVLGRLLNAMGELADRGPPLSPGVRRRPIHGPARRP